MKLVIDANVLFSALIKDGLTRKLIVDESLELHSPKELFDEFLEHLKELEKKTNVKAEILESKMKELFRIANIKVHSNISDKFIIKAGKFSPDFEDIIYFALALKLNCSIWSNDKRLTTQNKVKIISTSEVLHLFEKEEKY